MHAAKNDGRQLHVQLSLGKKNVAVKFTIYTEIYTENNSLTSTEVN